MFYCENEFEKISEAVVLLDYSPGYKLGDFNCGIKDYNDFLINEAPIYIEQNISRVKLLINKQSADVIAYMTLSSDSFILDQEEKKKENIDVPFSSVPALKIGKLAVSNNYKDSPYGSYMLWIALGFLAQINEIGVGCRFLVIDADVLHNPDTPRFYEKNGFVYNEKQNKGRSKNLSMRYDVFDD